jgi:hypothetical protein
MRVTASAALLALRMWWLVIAAMVVAGAALGVLAVRDSPYAAVTTLRVDTAGFGEVAQQSIVETTRELVDSNRVYAKVVGDAPGAIEELRQRTTVDPVASSSVLEIAVSAQTAEQAEQDVDALAEAAITVIRELADEQYTAAGVAGRQALETGVLPDPVAEQARRDQIGVAIATQQDNALRLSAQLSRIGEVLPATPTGLGSRIAATIGALTGALIGAVLALLLGVGRRRIRRLADVHAVAPGLVPCEPMDYDKGVMRVAAECSRLAHPLVVVLALPGAEDDLKAAVDELRSALYADGNQPFRIDATAALVAETEQRRRSGPSGQQSPSQLSSPVPALGMPQRATDLDEANSDTLLVTGEAEDRVVTMIGDRADIILLVAQPRVTRLGQLARITTGLGDGRPPVVVLAGHGAGERDDSRDALPPGKEAPRKETLRPAPIRPRVTTTDQPTMPAFEPVGAGYRPGERTLGRGFSSERLRPVGRAAGEIAVPGASAAAPGPRMGRGSGDGPDEPGSRSVPAARPAPEPPARLDPPLGGSRFSPPRGSYRAMGGPVPARSADEPPGGPDDKPPEPAPAQERITITSIPEPVAATPHPTTAATGADAGKAAEPATPPAAESPKSAETTRLTSTARPGAATEQADKANNADKANPAPAASPAPRPAPVSPSPRPRPDDSHSLFMPESQPTLKIRALDRAGAEPAGTGAEGNPAAEKAPADNRAVPNSTTNGTGPKPAAVAGADPDQPAGGQGAVTGAQAGPPRR